MGSSVHTCWWAAGARRHLALCPPCHPLQSFVPRTEEKTSGNAAFLPEVWVWVCVVGGRHYRIQAQLSVPVCWATFQGEGSCSRRPGGVALGPDRRRESAGPLPPACAGAEGSSGAASTPPGSPAGMLRLGRRLRQLVSGRGARTSARLPFGAEMPKKAGATNKASGKPRGRGRVGGARERGEARGRGTTAGGSRPQRPGAPAAFSRPLLFGRQGPHRATDPPLPQRVECVLAPVCSPFAHLPPRCPVPCTGRWATASVT